MSATAAAVLDGILSHLEPTGSARDARVRQALAAAATALREQRDALVAISEVYSQDD